MTRRPLLLTGILIVLLLLGACGGDDGGDSAPESGPPPSDVDASDEATSGGGSADSEPATPEGRAIQARREVIYTAEVDLTVDDVADAAASVVQVAEGAGGFQAGGSLQLDAPASGSVTVRVPAAAFRSTLTAIGGFGDVTQQRAGSQDVTDQVVDLESRLANARASVDRLRALLAEAPSVADVVNVERELTTREGEVEVLEGQLRVLQDQTSLSTITVRLTADASGLVAEPSDDIPSFLDGLRGGWAAFVNIVRSALYVVGLLAPLLTPAIVVVVGLVWWTRRRRRRSIAPAAG